jgi:arsenite/tail-anchored protein-transporting ATPase
MGEMADEMKANVVERSVAPSRSSSVPSVAAEALPSVVILAGKGGVGKTTVTAVMARGASDAGLKVLVVDVEGSTTWSRLLPDADGSTLGVVHLRAQDLLEEYLESRRMGRIARRLRNSGVLEVVGTAAPGIEDVVILGKLKQLERSGQWDLILVDAPAAGHAITMLTSPSGIAAAVSAGPLRTQADEVLEFLADPDRCMVMLVTLAEATPVNELIETAFALEDRVGTRLGPVLINRVDQPEQGLLDSDLAALMAQIPKKRRDEVQGMWAAAEFRQVRAREQQRQIHRLASELPLPQILLAQAPTAEVTAHEIAEAAAPISEWLAASFLLRRTGSTSDSGGATDGSGE